MAMASFNKENPFVIIMRKLDVELYDKSLKMTKHMFISVVSSITVALGLLVFSIASWPILAIAIAMGIFNIMTWRQIVYDSEYAKVNQIIRGDEFSAIYVNNEQIFDVIGLMNQAKGELIYFTNQLTFCTGVIIGTSIIYLIFKIF